MAMIRALLAGERHLVPLAPLRDYRGHQDQEAIVKALRGQWRGGHLFALAQAVALSDVDHQKIAEGDRPIEAHWATFADTRNGHAPPSGPRPRTRTQPAFEVQGALHRITGVDLTAIEGIDDTTALLIVREMGLDMGRWPTVKPFTSWVGVCPHPQMSGGKVLSRGTKPSANRVATALRLAASCLHHRRRALGAFFRRMKARLGTPKAITATAHTLARYVYTMLTYGTAYVAHSMDEYEPRHRTRVVAHVSRRAQELGDMLVQTPEDAPA
ncbi:MAG: transposase [Nitrospinae bacterium]|nr:transposase [Nitrospinota bacterium]